MFILCSILKGLLVLLILFKLSFHNLFYFLSPFRENLSKFEYLTMCIKEGMRLHSPVPFIQRYSTKETVIDGHKFPPGTYFSISLSSVHINPTVWKEPLKYDPERFSKDSIMNNKGYTYSFVPFSAGPRLVFITTSVA